MFVLIKKSLLPCACGLSLYLLEDLAGQVPAQDLSPFFFVQLSMSVV